MTPDIYDGIHIFTNACGMHVSRKTVMNSQILINYSSEPNETFRRGSGRPFATVDIKKM